MRRKHSWHRSMGPYKPRLITYAQCVRLHLQSRICAEYLYSPQHFACQHCSCRCCQAAPNMFCLRLNFRGSFPLKSWESQHVPGSSGMPGIYIQASQHTYLKHNCTQDVMPSCTCAHAAQLSFEAVHLLQSMSIRVQHSHNLYNLQFLHVAQSHQIPAPCQFPQLGIGLSMRLAQHHAE